MICSDFAQKVLESYGNEVFSSEETLKDLLTKAARPFKLLHPRVKAYVVSKESQTVLFGLHDTITDEKSLIKFKFEPIMIDFTEKAYITQGYQYGGSTENRSVQSV